MSKSISGEINRVNSFSGNIRRASAVYVKEIEFKTRFNFPAVGEENMLYIATDENASYRFDTDTLTYKCVGRDYEEVGIIQSIL